jgi:hypothetical protein
MLIPTIIYGNELVGEVCYLSESDSQYFFNTRRTSMFVQKKIKLTVLLLTLSLALVGCSSNRYASSTAVSSSASRKCKSGREREGAA